MSERWWETGGKPPMKPDKPVDNPAGFWMDPQLGLKIRLGASILTVIAVLLIFGWGGGAVIGILLAIFLTKPTSDHQRW